MGGDRITAHKMGKDEESFTPQYTLYMCMNNLPAVDATDHGTWRRICTVPWPITVAKPNPKLGEELLAELPGIVNWMIEGARQWLAAGAGRAGLRLPDDFVQKAQDYQDDERDLSPYASFVEKRVILGEGFSATSSEVGDELDQWNRLHTGAALTRRKLLAYLGPKVKPDRTNAQRSWRGVMVRRGQGQPGDAQSVSKVLPS